jgi:hypothetical protein
MMAFLQNVSRVLSQALLASERAEQSASQPSAEDQSKKE